MTVQKLAAPDSSTDLDSLAAQIRDAYTQASTYAAAAVAKGRKAVDEAVRCGRLLSEAKAQAGHGNWADWLEANVPEISDRTAEKWMQLAATDPKLIARASSVNEAVRHIRTDSDMTRARAHLKETEARIESPESAAIAISAAGTSVEADGDITERDLLQLEANLRRKSRELAQEQAEADWRRRAARTPRYTEAEIRAAFVTGLALSADGETANALIAALAQVDT